MPKGFSFKFVQEKEFHPPLDPGIERAVLFLRQHGFRTYASCEGGEGHAYPKPTVRFNGHYKDLLAAAGLLMYAFFPVSEVRRGYSAVWNELDGPYNEITFSDKVPLQEGDTLIKGGDR